MVKASTRTNNSVRNIIFSMLYYVFQLILTLLIRIIFLRVFLVEYLGVSSLFTNILTILSVVESGFGAAMGFALYQPVAEGNEEEVRELMALYKKYYRIIGGSIFLIGLALMPFLKYLIKDFSTISLNLYIIYLFYLINSLLSYFTAHRRSLFYATQRNDIESKINMISHFVFALLQIVAICCFKNFYFFNKCLF